MTDRAATIKFQAAQSKRVQLILDTGSDWAALRTLYRWEETARHARDWVEEMLGRSGLSGVAERSLGSGGATSEGGHVEEDTLSADETGGAGLDDENRGGLANSSAQAEGTPDDERVDETESEELEQAYDTASEDEDGEEDQLASASASADGDQQVRIGLTAVPRRSSLFRTRRTPPNSSRTTKTSMSKTKTRFSSRLRLKTRVLEWRNSSASVLCEMSRSLSLRPSGASAFRIHITVPLTEKTTHSAQLADRADSLVDLMTLPGATDPDLQGPKQTMVEGETVATFV